MEMPGRTIVVTGGSSGICKATAFLLARAGARILIGDVDEAGGREVAAEAATEGVSIEYLPLDTSALSFLLVQISLPSSTRR